MKKIPGFQDATVEYEKIKGYLLSDTHPIGKQKANFFKRFGFSSQKAEVLRWALKRYAENDFKKVEETGFGLRYIIDGGLESPDGRNPIIRSVWFVEKGEETPRFVTAYPVKED